MKMFEEQYKSALIEIEKQIEIYTNSKELLEQLKRDREYILNYLYPKQERDCKKIAFDLGITDTQEEISDFIISNQLYFRGLYNIYFINKNDKEIEQLFNDFITDNTFGLKNVYEEVILNNGLTYIDKSNKCWGRNLFIPSIKRNFIEIRKCNRLYETNSKVHELGHAKVNVECYNAKLNSFVIKNNSFLESYSIFLELMFADYLKKHGKKKQAYKLKSLIFESIKDVSKQLYDELDEYKKYSTVRNGLKYFFEMNYKSLKGYYLSLYFYYLFKDNESGAIEIINNFVKEVKFLNDFEIIKKFKLNNECFNRNNVYKLYKDLKEEKKHIKQK